MEFVLTDLKHIRKKLNLTQNQLAKQANVSQSLIAKIEAGRIDPTYSNVKKIEKALDLINHKQEQKAKDVMQTKIISANPNEKIHAVIQKMKNHGISQLPVIDKNTVVGIISETALLEGLLHKKGNTVEELMEEAPPIIAAQTNLSLITNLLQFSTMVLVAEKGKLIGLITKSDVLGKMR